MSQTVDFTRLDLKDALDLAIRIEEEAKERYELFADMGEADAGVLGVKKTKIAGAFPAVGNALLLAHRRVLTGRHHRPDAAAD